MSDEGQSLSAGWVVAIVFIALFSVVASYIVVTSWKRRRLKRRAYRSAVAVDDRVSRYYTMDVPLGDVGGVVRNGEFGGATGFSPITPGPVALRDYGRERRYGVA